MGKPISDSLTRDLSAYRTLALRVALGERPDMAVIALTHTLTAQLFYSYAEAGCLEVRPTVTPLGSHADGIEDTINQTGQQIVRRQLNVPPTLTIRPGHPLRVVITRDLVLEPIGATR